MPASQPTISDDLSISFDGQRSAKLTPVEGLMLAEDLTRKAFRQAIREESDKAGIPLDEPAMTGA